jgi:hypothetical protein
MAEKSAEVRSHVSFIWGVCLLLTAYYSKLNALRRVST